MQSSHSDDVEVMLPLDPFTYQRRARYSDESEAKLARVILSPLNTHSFSPPSRLSGSDGDWSPTSSRASDLSCLSEAATSLRRTRSGSARSISPPLSPAVALAPLDCASGGGSFSSIDLTCCSPDLELNVDPFEKAFAASLTAVDGHSLSETQTLSPSLDSLDDVARLAAFRLGCSTLNTPCTPPLKRRTHVSTGNESHEQSAFEGLGISLEPAAKPRRKHARRNAMDLTSDFSVAGSREAFLASLLPSSPAPTLPPKDVAPQLIDTAMQHDEVPQRTPTAAATSVRGILQAQEEAMMAARRMLAPRVDEPMAEIEEEVAGVEDLAETCEGSEEKAGRTDLTAVLDEMDISGDDSWSFILSLSSRTRSADPVGSQSVPASPVLACSSSTPLLSQASPRRLSMSPHQRSTSLFGLSSTCMLNEGAARLLERTGRKARIRRLRGETFEAGTPTRVRELVQRDSTAAAGESPMTKRIQTLIDAWRGGVSPFACDEDEAMPAHRSIATTLGSSPLRATFGTSVSAPTLASAPMLPPLPPQLGVRRGSLPRDSLELSLPACNKAALVFSQPQPLPLPSTCSAQPLRRRRPPPLHLSSAQVSAAPHSACAFSASPGVFESAHRRHLSDDTSLPPASLVRRRNGTGVGTVTTAVRVNVRGVAATHMPRLVVRKMPSSGALSPLARS